MKNEIQNQNEIEESLRQYLAEDRPMSELAKARPINMIKKEIGRDVILKIITEELDMCEYALGITSEKKRLLIIASDIIDRYGYDSIEDIVAAIRKGRRGEYGFGFEKRTLSMLVISDWMQRHLNEKAEYLERQHHNIKNQHKENEETEEQPEWLRKAIRKFCERIDRKGIKTSNAIEEYRAWREAIRVMNYYYKRGIDFGEVPKFISEFVAWRMKNPKHTSKNIPEKFREAVKYYEKNQ